MMCLHMYEVSFTQRTTALEKLRVLALIVWLLVLSWSWVLINQSVLRTNILAFVAVA